MKEMISEKKREMQKSGAFKQIYDNQTAKNSEFTRLENEIDQIKLMLVSLGHSNHIKQAPQFFHQAKSKLTFAPEETNIEEVKAYLDLELPKLRLKREKLEEERVLMRTLVNNMERNKKNWGSQGVGARAVALDGIKQKVQAQQDGLQKEEERIKEKL